MKKTQPQASVAVRISPPRIGPAASPIPIMPAQAPIA